ncbi:MAG: phenylalanine--tRNA ligase subunit alpha [Desulfurococcaceae archaeon]
MEEAVYLTLRQHGILKQVLERRAASLSEISSNLGVKQEDLMRDISELESRGLVKANRSKVQYYVLTELGRLYLEHGLPEEIVYRALHNCEGRSVEEFISCIGKLVALPPEEVRVGLQYLLRDRCLEVSKGAVVLSSQESCSKVLEHADLIKRSLAKISSGEKVEDDLLATLKKRKLVEPRERTIIVLEATSKLIECLERGLIREKQLVTVVKPDYALELDKYTIKEFDLSVELPVPSISRKHPFMQFIDELREVMISMGFEEAKGPHVEAELWNFDALFQAQDHPAREVHDTFFIKTELRARAKPQLIESIKKVHEAGWNYRWSPDQALRLVLRSQTTAVSARTIYLRGPGEYRSFTVDRNFRPENLDAKHSMEFYQLDGIIVGKNVNFKHLLYFFKEFAAALGIRNVWFKPGYFPFTEPSVEGYIKHPKLGWMEVFPGGMFRPEVMEMLGAKGYNAAAWGIGVDRLAMTVLGVDDIRLLFTKDLDVLSKIKYRSLDYFTKKSSGREINVVDIPT